MKGCLAYHYEITEPWNDYIGEGILHLSRSKISMAFLHYRVPDESLGEAGRTFQCRDDHRADQY